MTSRKRAWLVAGVALLLGAVGASQLLGTAQAYDDGSSEPQTMDQFLTSAIISNIFTDDLPPKTAFELPRRR